MARINFSKKKLSESTDGVNWPRVGQEAKDLYDYFYNGLADMVEYGESKEDVIQQYEKHMQPTLEFQNSISSFVDGDRVTMELILQQAKKAAEDFAAEYMKDLKAKKDLSFSDESRLSESAAKSGEDFAKQLTDLLSDKLDYFSNAQDMKEKVSIIIDEVYNTKAYSGKLTTEAKSFYTKVKNLLSTHINYFSSLGDMKRKVNELIDSLYDMHDLKESVCETFSIKQLYGYAWECAIKNFIKANNLDKTFKDDKDEVEQMILQSQVTFDANGEITSEVVREGYDEKGKYHEPKIVERKGIKFNMWFGNDIEEADEVEMTFDEPKGWCSGKLYKNGKIIGDFTTKNSKNLQLALIQFDSWQEIFDSLKESTDMSNSHITAKLTANNSLTEATITLSNGKKYPIKDRKFLDGKLVSLNNEYGIEHIMNVTTSDGNQYEIYDSGFGNLCHTDACAVLKESTDGNETAESLVESLTSHYRGFSIKFDTKDGFYKTFDQHGEQLDSGFRDVESAKKSIDQWIEENPLGETFPEESCIKESLNGTEESCVDSFADVCKELGVDPTTCSDEDFKDAVRQIVDKFNNANAEVEYEDDDFFEEEANFDKVYRELKSKFNKPLYETTNRELEARRKRFYKSVQDRLGVDSLVGTRKKWTEDELKEDTILDCISMIHSVLVYAPALDADLAMKSRYIQEYIKELGRDTVAKLVDEEVEELKQAKIGYGGRDGEGVSYKSVTYKDDTNEAIKLGGGMELPYEINFCVFTGNGKNYITKITSKQEFKSFESNTGTVFQIAYDNINDCRNYIKGYTGAAKEWPVNEIFIESVDGSVEDFYNKMMNCKDKSEVEKIVANAKGNPNADEAYKKYLSDEAYETSLGESTERTLEEAEKILSSIIDDLKYDVIDSGFTNDDDIIITFNNKVPNIEQIAEEIKDKLIKAGIDYIKDYTLTSNQIVYLNPLAHNETLNESATSDEEAFKQYIIQEFEKMSEIVGYCADIEDVVYDIESDYNVGSMPENIQHYIEDNNFFSELEEKVKAVVEELPYLELPLYEGELQLADNRVVNKIQNSNLDEQEYWNAVEVAVDKFNEDNDCELHLLGRMSRHVCIEDNFKNRKRFQELKDAYEKAEEEFIERMNKDE